MLARIVLITSTVLLTFSLQGQQTQLKAYIQTALESNVALQRRDLSYAQSLAALREAKAMFLPALSVQARFSVATGGRAFELPIGDLMNPVYQNLNLLNTLAQDAVPDYPAIPGYPQIDNERVNFLRETEQETFLRLSWPVFNSAIIYNQKIKENLAEAERVSVDVYRRELVREVKTAYFQYLKTRQGIALYENTLELVRENLRMSESLFRNHQVTVDEVYASRAQVAEVEQQLTLVHKQERVAGAFFNFLLNRPSDANILIEEPETMPMETAGLETFRGMAIRNREEFQQLNYYLAANDNRIKLERNSMLPSLNLVGDFGVQGINYAIDKDSDYAIGSIVLRWNVFDPAKKARVQDAQIQRMKTAKQKEELEQQIGLEVVDKYYALEVNRKNITSASAEAEAAQRAFELVQKKYAQGQANQVELTNARNQLTRAERNLIIARYDFQITLADLERVTGTYSFE